MWKTLNQWYAATVDTLHGALPVIMVALLYQITILELPVGDVMGMFGWLLFFTFGLVAILD